MSKIYALSTEDGLAVVVNGDSKEEAREIFISNQIDNEFVQEYVSRFVMVDSFFERFYRDEIGLLYDRESGLFDEVDRIREMDSEEKEAYILSCIEKNVKEYWKDKPQFAKEYLEQFHEGNRAETYCATHFSEEFWLAATKEVVDEGHYGDIEIIEIDFENTNYHLIKD
ncbi:hypothetical protein [Marinilactibacillus psychrotolerans]|uniref:hypothetical protein n=1 Tax=Marinilactibacillus psychrotolerans TaxID=191770 RepID=UPI0018691F6C|nr:hypothetical protein [Marinilactibacillus psychrotolerans]